MTTRTGSQKKATLATKIQSRGTVPAHALECALVLRDGCVNDVCMWMGVVMDRLKMYRGGKAIRNKDGKVVGGALQMRDRAGDVALPSTARIAPDRR